MTPRYPGARWIPTGASRSGFNSHRCHTWHEAVTTAGVDQIAGWNRSAHACHGFTAKDGDAGQYVDFDQIVAGTLDGNGYAITWETWDDLVPSTNRSPDGSHGANDFSWTEQQVERHADIAAWEVDALGIPLRFMSNTREAGHAPHRLGVPSAGGNVKVGYGPDRWTSHPGKECPGDRRILQLRDKVLPRAAVILAAVRAGRCGWLPQGPVNLAAAYARTGGAAPPSPEDELSAAEVTQIMNAIKDLPVAVWTKGITGDAGGHANELLAAIKSTVTSAMAQASTNANTITAVKSAVTSAIGTASGNAAMLQNPQGARLNVVIDDQSGAWYAVAPGTFFHLPDMTYVTEGRKAGLLDADEHHTTTAGVTKVRNILAAGVGPLYAGPASPTPPAASPPPAAGTYTVVSGDTFSGIAHKLGVSVDALKSANPQVPSPDQIDVGQVLTVPKG